MSGRVPQSPLSPSVEPSGSQRLVVKIARSVTHQWLPGRRRGGQVFSAPDTLAVFGSKNEHFVTHQARTDSAVVHARRDAELKTVSDHLPSLIGGLSR
jgi:hypothetical protein